LPTSLAPWSPGRCVTLQELVEGSIILKRKERRILAVVLAHSLLHLLDSLWLQHSWSGAEISFYHPLEGNIEFPNFRRPYLSTSLGSLSEEEKEGGEGHQLHPMPGMVTLGRMLLELERKDTSLSSDICGDSTSPLVEAKLLLEQLQDWYQDLHDNVDFIESMDKCLDMKTYTRTSFQHSDLMWNVYDKVIYPLERDLFRMSGPSTTLHDLEALLLGTSSEKAIRGPTQSSKDQSQLRQPILNGNLDIISVSDNDESDKWFKKLKETERFFEEGRKKTTKKLEGVRIAILDTGIDLSHPRLKGRIAKDDCRNFVGDPVEIRDEVGHGTHVASLLLKTATTARVFAARVFRTREADDNTCEGIAKAIFHAVDNWKAQIITMSFTFDDDNQRIKEALRHATSNRVLLFAAASNDRHLENDSIGFPARDSNVFCIYSERIPTFRSFFSPEGDGDETAKNFSLLGENVEGAWPLHLNKMKETKRDSGTSCATPIAAGVAALILEYTKHPGNKKIEKADYLGDREVMERVIFECMTKKNKGPKYNLIKPWLLFNPDADKAIIGATISRLIAGR